MNQELHNMAHLWYGNTLTPTRIEETTTKIVYFTHDSKNDTTATNVMNDTPSRVAFPPTQRSIPKETTPYSTPFLKKTAPRMTQISQHEFDGLKQTTKDQILLVYNRTMGSNTPLDRRALDSYSRICQALRFLGVGIFEYGNNSLIMPEDLLENWVQERNKLLFDWYEADLFTTKSLKKQASCSSWTFDELKAITARWMQGKDEDRLLEAGRKLMKIDDETRSKYQTSKNQEALVAKGKRLIEIMEKRLDEKTIGKEMQNEGDETEEEEVIREGFIQKGTFNTGRKVKLNAETLKMVNSIKEAHDAFTRRTARLLAHIVDAQDFPDSPRIPRNRRLEAPQPIHYPWINQKKRGRP